VKKSIAALSMRAVLMSAVSLLAALTLSAPGVAVAAPTGSSDVVATGPADAVASGSSELGSSNAGSSTGSLGSSGFGAPRTLNECRKVGLVGASLSAGPWPGGSGSRDRLKYNLRKTGKPFLYSAASGRSVTHAGKNTTGYYGNALQVIHWMRGQGVNCFIVQIGTNDAATTRGDAGQLSSRIDQIMNAVGSRSRVDWITPRTIVNSGSPNYMNHAFLDKYMSVMRRQLVLADVRYANLDVNHWDRAFTFYPGFWARDGVHLGLGRTVFADYVVRSLYIAGSR
jgi:hypothetical protein